LGTKAVERGLNPKGANMTIEKDVKKLPIEARPRIHPAWLQKQVLDENTPPKADPDKSAGELNEGRPHTTKSDPKNPKPKE
jgi:hypothetical protein